ncbi:MAG: hypothetical protein ACYTEQ_27660 [Planctomycetota bacterium]
MDAVKQDSTGERRLLIPNICIPEVFSIFAKYRFGKGNPQVKKTVSDLDYWRARLEFQNDIHNGKHIQQFELTRYHILAADLVAPVDHHFKYYRTRAGKKRRKLPMSASDHTIIGMGIELVKCRGADNVLLVTADDRFAHILEKAKRVPRRTAAKLGLLRMAEDLGLLYNPLIYPEVVNLAAARKSELDAKFGEWPIPTGDAEGREREKLTRKERDELIHMYKRVTKETSESVPYTDEFEIIYEAFLAKTGLQMDRNGVWRALSNIRKRGELPKRGRSASNRRG